MNQGRFNEAAAAYQQALRINANHPGPWNNLGNTLINLGQRNEAIECFKQALRINPNQAEVLNNLANAFIDRTNRSRPSLVIGKPPAMNRKAPTLVTTWEWRFIGKGDLPRRTIFSPNMLYRSRS